MKLPRIPGHDEPPPVEREDSMAIANSYAGHLTETGSRCHLNTGTPRYCAWTTVELPAVDADGEPMRFVAVRCQAHPGGRFLDSGARAKPSDFA